MSNLDNRRDAFEKKFAHDEELQFRVEARACRIFGKWVAGQLGLTGDALETYAREVVGSNLEERGFNDVKRKVQKDLIAKGLTISDHVLDRHLEEAMETAKQQISAE